MDRSSGHPYDDILHLPHHVSGTRPPMSRQDRAAQFSPFAALSGYGALLREVARQTEARVELTESSLALLDEKLRVLRSRLSRQPEITATWFVPDERKEGGAYVRATGRVKRVDPWGKRLLLTDGTEIPLEALTALEGAVFEDLD